MSAHPFGLYLYDTFPMALLIGQLLVTYHVHTHANRIDDDDDGYLHVFNIYEHIDHMCVTNDSHTLK